LNVAFQFIDIYNATGQTYFECKYYHLNKIEDAIFEIEQMQQKLSCTLRFGFEQLPSWDKKLSEISLDKFTLPIGTTIYQHANTIVSQTWPAVNYNFPQIHIDKISTDDAIWAEFKKILNNRISGAFLINEVDDVNEIMYNRNIMQPLPYWLHILERGFADAGYILDGQILNDPLLKIATLYADVQYYSSVEYTQQYIYKTEADAVETGTVICPGTFTTVPVFSWQGPQTYVNPVKPFKRYSFNQVLTDKGRYKISGKVTVIWSFYFDCF